MPQNTQKEGAMRSNSSVRRRFTIGIVLSMFLMALSGISMPASAEDAVGVAPDTTLTAGQIYVWEDASAWPASSIYFGYSDGGFTTTDPSMGYNAWAPYANVEDARDGACQTASNRLANDGFTAVTVNDQVYDSASCNSLEPVGSAPEGTVLDSSEPVADSASESDSDTSGSAQITASTDPSSLGNDNIVALPNQQDGTQNVGGGTSGECVRAAGWTGDEASGGGDFSGSIYDTTPINGAPDPADYDTNPIKRIPEGACRDAGLVVMRFVNNQTRTIDVSVRILDGQQVVFGKDGEIALDGWEGYGSPISAAVAACGQALGDAKTTDDSNSWNYLYTVTFNEGPVPSTCE